MNRSFILLMFVLFSFSYSRTYSSINLECNDIILDDSIAYGMIDTSLSLYYTVYGDSVVKLISVKKICDYGVVVVVLDDEYDENYFDMYQYEYSDEERNNKKFFWYKNVLVVFHLNDSFDIKEGVSSYCEIDTWFSSRSLYLGFGFSGELLKCIKDDPYIYRNGLIQPN